MLYEFLRERMLQNPRQTLSDQCRTFTYKEALEYSKALARKLAQNKYGVLCRSELNAGLGILSCLAAGKTAVPLSYRYGQAHTERIIRHIGISLILTDENGALEVRQIADPMPEPENLTDVALILCTSGTTGTPKGAMITHENLMTNLLDIERYFYIGDSDRILIARPLYHCAVLTGEFLISLCRGLDISFYNGEFNPIRLTREIVTRDVSVLCGTPTLFYHLCQMAKRQKMPLPLKAAAVSGECMTEVVAKSMRSVLPSTEIYNVYGLTEASPSVSALSHEQFDTFPLSVGFPLRSVESKTENGELLIHGKSIMRGYYNDPTQTVKALADGWLHTGDAAELDDDGRIFIKGRKDNMIIRAGMNIYPQEIESALKSDPRISEAFAFGVLEGITQRLHVRVVAEGLSKAELMSICRERLPAYEIPDAAEIVDALPRNASGKLLRPKVVMSA